MSCFDIKNKVVLITGASVGIGRAAALRFAKAGAKAALVSRNESDLKKTAEEITKAGGSAETFPADLSRLEGIPELVNHIKQKMGPIDVLINNAAYAVAGLVEDCPMEQYKKNFDVNFFAPIALIQAVLPAMKQKRSGQIINVSSGVGRRALPGVSSYCSTKFALNGMSESLRLEVKPFGIDVIVIFPGRVASHFHERIESYGKLNRKLPPLKMRQPEEIAELIYRASRCRSREKSVSGPGKIGYHLNYWAPRLVDRLLEKRFPVPQD